MTEKSLNDFDDEVLSAIIDEQPDAPAETDVAADPAAQERLSQLRRVSELVAEDPPPATAARRASSIAAAMLAAESLQSDDGPAVASLTAKRETKRASLVRRIDYRWVGAAAAAILLVVAIPLASRVGPDATDTATSTESADSASFGAGDDGEASASDSADAAEDAVDDGADAAGAAATTAAAIAESDAMDDEAMFDDSAEEEAMEEEAALDSGDADDAAQASEDLSIRTATSVSSLLGLDELLEVGAIVPTWTLEEILQSGIDIGPPCIERFETNIEAQFNVVTVGDEPNVDTVLIYFDPDADIELLDPVECVPYR